MEKDNHAHISALILISGVLLSTILGVFFYFRTDLSTAMATFAGLIGTTITLQVEALLRGRQSKELATRHQRVLARIESTSWLPDLLDRALIAYGQVEQNYRSELMIDLAHRSFENCRVQLESLARGRYSTPDPDESPNSPIYGLTEQVKNTILATTAGFDLEWWQHSLARTYWRLNEEALRRGVVIKRIIIYREWTAEMERLARSQSAAGVQIMRVDESQLPPALRLNLVIWDGVCAMEPEYNSVGEWISTHFNFGAQDLALSLDRYKLIESCSEPWPRPPGA